MNPPVSYQLNGPVATLTMDDGKANAMSLTMISELNQALDRAVADRAAVVLTGRAGMFSGGFDLRVLSSGGAESHQMVLAGFRLAERLLSAPVPVVIACSGHAIAMGVFLVLSGDYRLGAEGAFKIGANEVAIGLTMPWFATELCRQRLTPAHFQRAVINAEFYQPVTAVEAGFLDRVVSADSLLAEARKLAAGLAALPRAAHTASKLRARDASLKTLRAAIEADDADLARLFKR